MKLLCVLFFSLFLSHPLLALDRMSQDIKLPTQVMLEKDVITSPIAANTNQIIEGYDGDSSGFDVLLTSVDGQPDVARNLVVTPAGTTADVAAGNVVITGVDIRGNQISETFAIVENQAVATVGNKAFFRVDTITLPAEASPFGATWSVGVGSKLGVRKCLDGVGFFDKAINLSDGALVTTAFSTDSSDLSLNTVTVTDDVPNGTLSYAVLYIQNFCN